MKKGNRNLAGRVAIAAALAIALLALPGMAAAKDRNADNIPDSWERANDLSLEVNQARRDQDHDGLRNRGEFRAAMDPRDADSDDDGVEDGDENAGTVESYDSATGVLVVNLLGGKTVEGLITEETEIECANDDAVEPDDETTARPGPLEGAPPAPGQGGHGAGCDDDDGSECSAEDLVAGAAVAEASMHATADGLVFDEIELG